MNLCFLFSVNNQIIVYLFRTEGEQKLYVLAGGQDSCPRADLESLICGWVKLDMRGLWSFPWKQRVQVWLHNLPVVRKL